MLTKQQIEGVKKLKKYRNAVDLLYHDTIFRYSTHSDLVVLHCLLHDDFITKDEFSSFKETAGSIIIYNTSTKLFEIVHDITINEWINTYCKDANFIDRLELNLILIDEE